MNTKINYIVALYCGPRMSRRYSLLLAKDKLYFFNSQIEALNKFGEGIDLVSFVFNVDSLEQQSEIINNLNLANITFKYEIIVRENVGASYGAWMDCIHKNIHEYDYFFMIEDDYIPVCNNFYEPFINKCTDKIQYVCCRVFREPEDLYPHASISNGLITASVCKNLIYNNNSVFLLYDGNNYLNFYQIQKDFLHFYRALGFELSDILEKYSVPFYDSSKDAIVHYGNINGNCLLEPL